MKQINVYFDDDEHTDLVTKKGKKTWHDFILELIREDKIEQN